LPFEEFLALIKSEELGVREEIVVVNLVNAYIERRQALPKELDEVDPDEAKHLTPDEIAKREEDRKLRAEEKVTKLGEEQKAKEDKVTALKPVERIQFNITDG